MKRSILLVFLLFLLVGFAHAQIKVTGRVTDASDGNGMPFVSVAVKGTTTGTTTDVDGNYSLSVPNAEATLIFSFVGYKYLEQAIAGKGVVNAVMESETSKLDEVVVTAYGSMRKSAITGASTRIAGEVFKSLPVQSFDQALAGRIAGVQVSQSSGLLADGVNIRVRGTNSISMSAQPLVVIDGVPMNVSSNVNNFNDGNSVRFNPMATINPNDIESMEVLKDAAASALYGSRAANGVLLITTKRGKAGQSSVSYNGFVGISSATRAPKLLNGDDFITISNEKASNLYGEGTEIAANIDMNGDGVSDRTNWIDRVFRTGVSHNHQISIMGGNDKSSYYGSVDYMKQDGFVFGNEMTRGSVRLNADTKVGKWLKIGILSNYSKTLNKGVLSDGYLAGVTVMGYNAPPNVPEYVDGEFYLASGYLGSGNNKMTFNGANTFLNRFYHPTATVSLQRNNNTTERILGSTYAEITFIEGLKFTSKVSVDYLKNFEDQYSSPRIAGLGRSFNGLVQTYTVADNTWNWQNYANYNVSFDEHNLGLTAGIEYQENRYQNIYAGGGNIADELFQDLLDGLYTDNFSGGARTAKGFESYFGRANWDFRNRYFVEASFRSDAFSGFGKNNRRGFFPGISAGWKITEEDFCKNLNWDFLSDFRLRGSWGKVGNADIDAYAYRTLYSGGQYANLNGLSIFQVGNNDLKWETVAKTNIGFDAGLFQNRLNVTFEWWNTRISDMLLAAPTLYTVGIPGGTVFRNVGKMTNRGIELAINSLNMQKLDFTWNTSFNITTVKNKVTELADGNDITTTFARASVGRPLGVWYLIDWAGVDPQTGQAMYYDKEGTLKKYNPDTKKWTDEAGNVVSDITGDDAHYQEGKSGTPRWYGNIDNILVYKDFDLNIGFQFAGGFHVYNATRSGLMTMYMNNNLTEIKNRWQAPGDITDVPRLTLRDAISLRQSTRYLERGDYLRLRDITLGYTVKGEILKKANISMLRVYARGSNLFLLTGYKGADSDISTARNSSSSDRTTNIAAGVDNRSVPFSKTFIVGLNLTF